MSQGLWWYTHGLRIRNLISSHLVYWVCASTRWDFCLFEQEAKMTYLLYKKYLWQKNYSIPSISRYKIRKVLGLSFIILSASYTNSPCFLFPQTPDFYVLVKHIDFTYLFLPITSGKKTDWKKHSCEFVVGYFQMWWIFFQPYGNWMIFQPSILK